MSTNLDPRGLLGILALALLLTFAVMWYLDSIDDNEED